jgi:hypothetical protein
MTEDLRAQVVENERSNKRKRWILILLVIPALCCLGCFLLAWFTGDAVMGFLGLTDFLQP